MNDMLKTFSILSLAILFSLSGLTSVVFAHGGEVDGHSETTMKMDEMMSAMMRENRVVNCVGMNETELIEKGESLMLKMAGDNEEKHKSIEEAMEKIAGMEFHDMIHIMMGRMASGCFTDEQQKVVASKLMAGGQSRTNQALPLATGIVIGLIVGLVGISFFRKN